MVSFLPMVFNPSPRKQITVSSWHISSNNFSVTNIYCHIVELWNNERTMVRKGSFIIQKLNFEVVVKQLRPKIHSMIRTGTLQPARVQYRSLPG